MLREAELPGKSLGWWNSCTIARFSRCSVSISTLPVPTLLPVLDEGTRYRNRHPGAENLTDAVSINNNSARTWFPVKKKSILIQITDFYGFLASIISNLFKAHNHLTSLTSPNINPWCRQFRRVSAWKTCAMKLPRRSSGPAARCCAEGGPGLLVPGR